MRSQAVLALIFFLHIMLVFGVLKIIENGPNVATESEIIMKCSLSRTNFQGDMDSEYTVVQSLSIQKKIGEKFEILAIYQNIPNKASVAQVAGSWKDRVNATGKGITLPLLANGPLAEMTVIFSKAICQDTGMYRCQAVTGQYIKFTHDTRPYGEEKLTIIYGISKVTPTIDPKKSIYDDGQQVNFTCSIMSAFLSDNLVVHKWYSLRCDDSADSPQQLEYNSEASTKDVDWIPEDEENRGCGQIGKLTSSLNNVNVKAGICGIKCEFTFKKMIGLKVPFPTIDPSPYTFAFVVEKTQGGQDKGGVTVEPEGGGNKTDAGGGDGHGDGHDDGHDDGDDKDDKGEKFSSWIYTAALVTAILVICACIICVLCCFAPKKQNLREVPEREDQAENLDLVALHSLYDDSTTVRSESTKEGGSSTLYSTSVFTEGGKTVTESEV